MTEIAIVIATYKAEGCLEELYSRLVKVLEREIPSFKILFIEDCGGDRSWEIISRFTQIDNRVQAIRLSKNFGQHYAITAGIAHASARWIMVMDCDLQDDPELIPALYKKALEGYDVVMTHRVGKKHSLWRRAMSSIWANSLSALSGSTVDSRAGTFSIISEKVQKAFLELNDYHRHYMILLRWLGFKTYIYDIEHRERFEGKSSYSLVRLLKHAVDGLVAQSTRILLISIFFGFTISLISIIGTFWVLYRYYTNSVGVPGWASGTLITLFVGGSIHISAGILGIYLGKTFEQAKRRPLFIVDRKLNF